MTRENIEIQYKNFRNAEANYIARPELNKGLVSTDRIKAKAKRDADAMLKKYSYLEKPVEPKKVEVKKDGKK